MIITVEISHYPLVNEYEAPIIDFIKTFRNVDQVECYSNSMSTYVKGESTLLFKLLDEAIKLDQNISSTVIKIINRDLPIKEGMLSF